MIAAEFGILGMGVLKVCSEVRHIQRKYRGGVIG